MKYDVDDDYRFETTDDGLPILPRGMKLDGNLMVLPNGKYLPRGVYHDDIGGGDLIYEPPQLSPFADMLASCTEE